MHGWPGGLSTQMPAFPLFFLSLAAHTPAAQNQAVQSWPGGGAGRRSDTHTEWEGALATDLWEGFWGPRRLASQRGREPKEASEAEGLELSSPCPPLQSCLKLQLPLQSLPLQSPPAIAAVGRGWEEDRLPISHFCLFVGGKSRCGVSRDGGLLGNVLFLLSLSSPEMCQR